jgi:hypothetical protein
VWIAPQVSTLSGNAGTHLDSSPDGASACVSFTPFGLTNSMFFFLLFLQGGLKPNSIRDKNKKMNRILIFYTDHNNKDSATV